jgi:hypothetical protein
MRERVAELIDQRVEERVRRQMSEFRADVMRELED